MGIVVKNLNNTSDKKPETCSSWKEFWEEETGKEVGTCAKKGCSSKAEVGAHVKKVGDSNKEYIVPFCKACNAISSDNEIELKAGVIPKSVK